VVLWRLLNDDLSAHGTPRLSNANGLGLSVH